MVAVSAGMPPTLSVTSMAIGVVTDLAASESTTSVLAPIRRAIPTTDTTPTTQPANCDSSMGKIS